MNCNVAFYGGSFDPFTEGHRVCLCHAIAMYDRVIVGIRNNHDKNAGVLLSSEQRVLSIKDSLSDFVEMFKHRDLIGKEFSVKEVIAAERLIAYPDCVKVVTYNGLTVDAAICNGAGILVRGERMVGDHDSEMQLSHVNNELCKIRGYELQMVILPVSNPDLTYVSSTLVRTLVKEGEYIAAMKYVSPSVHSFLCEEMLKYIEYDNITSEKRIHCSDLVRSYRKNKYHNFSHVAYMLNFLKIFKIFNPEQSIHDKEIKFASFWHDFVTNDYEPEKCSAEYAWKLAVTIKYDNPDLVKELILATDHARELDNHKLFDLALIHDLDLAILGDEQNYGLYSYLVMREAGDNLCQFEEYAKRREKFLSDFLSKKRIFETEYFYNRFESIARRNLSREKAFWQSKI